MQNPPMAYMNARRAGCSRGSATPGRSLKRFGERLCGKGGKIARRKAKVALARKLAVVMAALLTTRRPYENPFAGKDGAKDGTEGAA